MSMRALRRRCARLAGQVEVPDPFDIDQFCAGLARTHGRRVVPMPVRTPAHSPCGLWIEADGLDYVFYETATSRVHQEHIVAHEIGHLLFDHPGTSVLSAGVAARMPPGLDPVMVRRALPDLDPAMVRRVLGRADHSAQEEAEAELFATMVLHDVARRPAPRPGTDAPTVWQLNRVVEALGDRVPPRW